MKSGAMRVSLVVLGLLLLFFSLPVQAESTPATFEGPGFASPEEAVTGYLNALREADVDGILQSFAIELYVDNFDFTAQLQRMGVYLRGPYTMDLPASHGYTRNLNVYQRLGTISRMVKDQFLALFLPDHDFSSSVSLPRDSEKDVADFVNLLGDATYLDDLATLEIGELLRPSSLVAEWDSDRIQELLVERAERYGSSQIFSLAAKVKIAESEQLLFFETARYGDGWYIIELGGLLAILHGVPAMNGGVWLD